jgi:hypothetical protein
LAIPLNKNYIELKALSDEKCYLLIKTCNQLQMLIIMEISLVSNRMLTFIDCKLGDTKQTPKEFMGGLDVIMTSDFYQGSPIQESLISKSRTNGLNIFGTNFWQENKKHYELKKPCAKMFLNSLTF